MDQITLNNGERIPSLGFGTWRLKQGSETQNAVSLALQYGYRLIDTAALYANEESVGMALGRSGLGRDEVFVTTKLWNDDHEDVEKAFEQSLYKLGVDFVDLYLIHWPVPQRNASWKKFENFLESGKARSIGVSNFTVTHLEELLQKASIVPAVNQVEFNCFLYQKELLDYCRKKGILLQAYCPLARAHKLENETLKEIASSCIKTPAQVMLRWCIQKGVVPIPKSTHQQRIKENLEVFDFTLSQKQMAQLDALNENYRNCWDPSSMV